MKLRTLFVTDRKQVDVPEGWEIDRAEIITHPKRKAQYVLLLKKNTQPKPPIGFKK